MLKGKWARVMGLAGASSLAALLLMVALVGLAQAQEEKPPPVANLKCEIESDRVRFSWDIPEWSGGEIKYYDLVVTLPNGNRFIQRNHWMLRSRTDRGNWQPGREARISVKALYDVPGGERVTSEANGLACVVPGTPNSAPAVSSAIADATIVSESGAKEVSLAGVFSDADNDALTVTASSSDDSVATVSVSADYSALTVAAKSRGAATITVTASDGNGGTVEGAFTATVKSAPVVASAIADVSELEIDATHQVSLSGVFSDADGEALTITASSSDEGKATVSAAADGSNLTLTGVSEGTATVTVTAEDTDGNRVSDAFDVAVVEAEEAQPPNSAPTVASAIADATIVNESGAKDVSLSGVFSDADNDDLTITASSSDDTVATAPVSADQSALTVAAKSRGTATITVTASDGNGGTVEDTFTATVKSAPVVASAIADVSELEIDATHQVSMSGVFSDADGDALAVTEASSSDGAVAAVLVAIDGSTAAITGITVIGKDEGTATITVTARDSDGNGVSDAFDVTVPEAVQLQRTLSSDATLNGLSLSGYTLNGDPIPAFGLRPAFASGTTDYAASAPQFTAWVRVTATATDPGAAVQVDGQTVASGAPSQLIRLLDNRPKRITVTVTAADGATRKTYAVMATSNPRADLRALSMSPGELWPRVFSTSDKTYSAWLPYSVESVRVTATGRHGGETLTVNGKAVSSGQPSPDIALDVGENLITVVATAPDGYTTSSYTVAATRLTEAQSSDATLSAIKVYQATSFQPDSANNVPYEGDPLTIAPAVSRTEREYRAEQPEGDGIYVAVAVTTNAPGARSIVIDGPKVNLERRDPKDEVVSGEASGPWQMSIGYRLITITVTSPDGKNTETYRLVIKRGTVDDLKGLRLSSGDGSLTLRWDASDSPTAPTDYMLRWRKAGETTWLNRGFPAGWKTSYALDAPDAGPADGDRYASVSHGSATLSGLENGTAYEVQARGARGPLNPGTGERRVFVFLRTDWQSLTGTPSAPKQPLTITPSSPTREYGEADDLAYSVGGLLDGDAASEVVTGTLSRASGDDAGDYAIGMGALAVASAYAAKYSLPAAPSVTTYTITPRPVTAISGVTVTSRAADGTTDATFDTAAAAGTGVLASELADFRAGGLQVSGTFPSTAAGAHDVSVTYSLRDQGSFKAANYSLSATTASLRGEITSEATELPGPVTGLELSATFDSVKVSWSAPESGGAPDGYIVHLRPEGGSEGSGRTRRPGADKTTATFDNLESSRTYRVWVRAQNEAGRGERVHASITLPAELPGPVTGLALTATEGAADSVTVSWSAPESGGAPDGYIAHLRLTGGAEGSGRTKTPKASKTQVTFGNLESGTTYKVWVRAENEAGKGERVQAEITLLTITPLTITPNSPTREYGETDDLAYSVGGLLDGDAASDVVTGTLSRASGDDAGDYAIGMGTLAVASAYAGKYSLPAAPSVTTYTITPRPVTAISGVTVASRAADGTTDATFNTSAAAGTGVLPAELADFRAGGLQVSGAFPSTAAGAHDVSVTYSLQDNGTFKAANYSLSMTTATLRGEITASTDELVCVPAGFKDTTDDPDLANIYTLADLDAMREDPGKGYELMADLDFDTNGNGRADAGDAYWNGGAGWDYIGLDGVFDGNGHTIRNLYINVNAERSHVGLFSSASRDSEIRNLRLESVSVTTGRGQVGALVGSNSGKIIDVYATGTVNGSFNVGGLVGWAASTSVIIASAFEGDVTSGREAGGLVGTSSGGIIAGCSSGSVTNTRASYDAVAGGLSASNDQPGYVIASYSSSHVTVASDTRYAGGLIGLSTGPTTASYATGRVSGGIDPGGLRSYVGALIGSSPELTDSYWNKDSNPGFHTESGWLFTDQWKALGKTTRQLQSPTGYTGIYANWNVDLNGDGSPDDPWGFGTSGEYPTLKYSGLDDNPTAVGRPGGTDYDTDDDGLIEISGLEQLNAVRWDINGDGGPNRAGYRAGYAKAYPDPATAMGCPQDGCVGYELTADLDFDTNGSGAADAGDDYWNGGAGWTPIQDQGLAFRAVFEGNGHTISNLYINDVSSDAFIGLFRAITHPGVARNVGLVSASVTVVNDNEASGALAGMNAGEISGAYMTGSVSGSYAAGGLVGFNNDGGRIAASYAAGRVSGNGRDVGGLVAFNDGEIASSYAMVSVEGGAAGAENVGGLVGYNESGGVIRDSYAAGAVSGGGANVGGLVGFDKSRVSASYWDTETTGQASSAAGAGKTTAELQEPTGYAGIYADWNVDLDGDGSDDDPWDFGTSCQYPVLKYGSLNPDDQREPCEPTTTSPYSQVSAGHDHACALRLDGRIDCWGENEYGESTPPSGTFKQVSAGSHFTCAIKSGGATAGRVECWGKEESDYGEEDLTPPPSGTFTQIDAGSHHVGPDGGHVCGVMTDGQIVCWGDIVNYYFSPPAGTFKQVSTWWLHACAVNTDDEAVCWGTNGPYAKTMPPAGTFKQVAVGDHHSCGLKTDGQIVCWGENGPGPTTPPAGTFTQISSAVGHSCAVRTDGQLACWGHNDHGQSTPPAGTFTQVSSGSHFSCAVRTDHQVLCWGKDEHGETKPENPTTPTVADSPEENEVCTITSFHDEYPLVGGRDAKDHRTAAPQTAHIDAPVAPTVSTSDWNVSVSFPMPDTGGLWIIGYETVFRESYCGYVGRWRVVAQLSPSTGYGTKHFPDTQGLPSNLGGQSMGLDFGKANGVTYEFRYRPFYYWGPDRDIWFVEDHQVGPGKWSPIASLTVNYDEEKLFASNFFANPPYDHPWTIDREAQSADITLTGESDDLGSAANDLRLDTLELPAGFVISPDFRSDHYEYEVTVPNSVEHLSFGGDFTSSWNGNWEDGFGWIAIGDVGLFDRSNAGYYLYHYPNAMVVANSMGAKNIRRIPLVPGVATKVEIGVYKWKFDISNFGVSRYGQGPLRDNSFKRAYTLTVTRDNTPSKPLPVENVRLSPTMDSVTVNWDASRAGYPPNRYIIRLKSVSDGKTMTKRIKADEELSVTFDGLDAGATHQVSVRASNELGESAWSHAQITLPTAGDLSGLAISAGSLDFAYATAAYTVSVGHSVSSVTLTPSTFHSDATVTVDGEDPASAVSLDYGANVIAVVVTAPDGVATQTYTVTVNRPLPLKPGPPTDGQVEATTDTITNTWQASTSGDEPSEYVARLRDADDSEEEVRLGADARRAAFDGLEAGATYTVAVRAGNDGGDSDWVETRITLAEVTDLADLTISDGSLTFDRATTSYTVNVGHSVSSVTLTPATSHTDATVTVDGGDPAAAVSLNYGANVIEVVVTAPDGVATKSYTVTVNRALPSKPGRPQNARVDSSADAITITWQEPTSGDGPTHYVARLRDAEGGAGEVRLDADARRAVFDGLEAGGTYTVGVRAANDVGESDWAESEITLPLPAALSSLIVIRQRLGLGTVAGTNLISDPAVTEYEIELSEDDLYLTLRPTAQRPGTSTITVNGSAVASGGTVNVPRPGRGKTKVESIVVREGDVERIYTLTVKRGG